MGNDKTPISCPKKGLKYEVGNISDDNNKTE